MESIGGSGSSAKIAPAATTSSTATPTATAATTVAAPAAATAATTTISASSSSCSTNIGSTIAAASSNTASVLVSSGSVAGSVAGSAAVCLPNFPAGAQQLSQQQQQQQQQQQLFSADIGKQEDANNSSLVSAISEGQRSLSGAPSASSSPILSPPGKIFGRNANGTLVATSRPNNEAETQLYRVLQRASLLVYYDTLLEMGGDDVQQLYEAGEEEFLEIMALVGMASKPLHVRRLQKALHEWANNPSLFQGPITSSTPGLFDTPTKSPAVFTPEPSPSFMRSKFPTFTPTPAFNPTPLISTSQTSSSHLLSQMCTPAVSVPVIQPHTPLQLPTSLPAAATALPQTGGSIGASVVTGAGAGAVTTHQVTSSSPQLTPVLTEMQVTRITLGAEKIARQLPQREPRAQTSKKRTSRELEQVIAMHENDPRRMDEIRKYSAIYGRFDCKRRPEKPLTLHEVCVNEAAAQLCRLVPALLTRRDELFPLARQIVKDAGFGHSASIARYGGLLPQIQQAQPSTQRTSVLVDCESSDSATASLKRQRLSSTETTPATDLSRESTEDSRYNLFAMYQKFAKPPFDLSDITKFTLGKTEFDDNDNDSRLSFSSSSSPSLPPGSLENERELSENVRFRGVTSFGITQTAPAPEQLEANNHSSKSSPRNLAKGGTCPTADTAVVLSSSPLGGGVQVISAAGGHIIAVANPALALSPTLNEALSLKREANSPEI